MGPFIPLHSFHFCLLDVSFSYLSEEDFDLAGRINQYIQVIRQLMGPFKREEISCFPIARLCYNALQISPY